VRLSLPALRPASAALLLGLTALAPLLPAVPAAARGLAVAGPRGGGFYHFGGGSWGGARPVGDTWRNGYEGWHPAYGPGVRPAWTNTNGDRPLDINRNVNVNNNFYNRDYHGWNAAWSNGGYWGSRPWHTGWYAWTPASWGWWGGSAAAWGLAGLATGVAITELVNQAASQQQTVFVVPGTTWLLNYGTVESVGTYGVSFSYGTGADVTVMAAANCQLGLLNGQPPQSAAQAQLLNAACPVAYGAGG
jgi:hypothetical protein